MARLTVEDCLDKVRNRFDLILVAARRARQLELGKTKPLVPEDKDKPTVIALREIANNLVDEEVLQQVEDAVEQRAQMTANGATKSTDNNTAAMEDAPPKPAAE